MNEHDRHTTGALAEALSKVQAGLPKLERDRTVEVVQKNGGKYSYSYVTLANLNDAILPLLAKNGLAFTAMPSAGSDGKMALRYHLLHASGESLTGEFPISGDGGIQMVGGRITYARRYVLAALVGVAADEDDESRLANEGAPATAQRNTQPRQKPAKQAGPNTQQRAAAKAKAGAPPPLPGEDPDAITKAQLQKLAIAAKQAGIDSDRDTYLAYIEHTAGRRVESSKELTKAEAHKVIDSLENEIDAGDAESPDEELPDAFPDEPQEDT